VAAVALAHWQGIPPEEGLKRIGPGDVSVTLWRDLTALLTKDQGIS
jgi:hypothetical protein